MGKRANGEGSIFRFRNDRGQWKWKATVSFLDSNGKRRRRSRVCDSKTDAAILLQTLRAEVGSLRRSGADMTLADYLTHWLAVIVKPETEETTHHGYQLAVENHIAPHLGSVLLSELDPLRIQAWLAGLNVGSRTRQNAFSVLRNALNQAMAIGRIPANPCSPIKTPGDTRKTVWPFTREEAKSILTATAKHRLQAVFVLMFHLGMRQSEVFGLQWDCVDFDDGTLRIERAAVTSRGRVVLKEILKTQSSRRTLSLADDTLRVLETHRKRMLREGRRELVFCGERGAVIQRGNFRTRVWRPLLKKLKIAYRGPHHCRHTFASLALQDGVPLIAVSRILGHSKPSVTLNVYGHMMPAQDREAAERTSRMYG